MKKINQTRFENLLAKGRQLFSDADYANAAKAFDRVIDFNTGFGQAYFERGVCYYQLGQYHRAMDDFNAAAVLGCETAQIWCRHQITITDQKNENTYGEPYR